MRRPNSFPALLAVASFQIFGCAVRQQPAGLFTPGYAVTELAPGVYEIEYRNWHDYHSNSPPIEALILFRAAQLAQARGDPLLVVLHRDQASVTPSYRIRSLREQPADEWLEVHDVEALLADLLARHPSSMTSP